MTTLAKFSTLKLANQENDKTTWQCGSLQMEVATDIATVNATYVDGTFVLMSVSMACMGYVMPSGWVEHEGSRPAYAPVRAMMVEQAEVSRLGNG